MKRKIIIFLVACGIGISSSFACSFSECGGGNDKCCTDHWGALYYCKAKPPGFDSE